MKKYFIILFLCMLPSAFAESIKLDLQSALKLAYENNTNLKRQKITLDAAARNTKTSLNTLLPSINLSAGDTYVFPEEENANSINVEGNISLNLKSSF
ncbi:MAG: TolC family protein, partial [Treponema sp.]|nr:TolC family protein [Treponema sp.]